MAKRSLSVNTLTPTVFADTTNMTDSTYFGVVQGGSATQRNVISEVMLTGQAAASAPMIILLARDSQVGTGANTYTAGTMDAALDPATAALAAPPLTGDKWATNKPQRSSSLHLLNLSFNAFGGIVRWLAAPGEEIGVIGNTASLGEVSLSCFTGGTPGLMGSHLIYEPL